MTTRSAAHATFCLERSYDASPARVFGAFADGEAKAAWFRGPPEWGEDERTFDFREGGSETAIGGPPGGWVSHMDLTYHDIVPDQRIVYTYVMTIDGKRLSVSLATIEFTPEGKGTKLVLTEAGVYLDAHDTPIQREEGTGWILDQLGAYLKANP